MIDLKDEQSLHLFEGRIMISIAGGGSESLSLSSLLRHVRSIGLCVSQPASTDIECKMCIFLRTEWNEGAAGKRFMILPICLLPPPPPTTTANEEAG